MMNMGGEGVMLLAGAWAERQRDKGCDAVGDGV